MSRLLMAAIVALGLAACGGAEDDGWVVEADIGPRSPVLGEGPETPSPAQKLMVLLAGGPPQEKASTAFTVHGNEGASSPDPMPGRQRDDGGELDERRPSPLR